MCRGVRMRLLDAIRDPKLYGGHPAFHDLESWRPWLTFIAACYGEPLDAYGLELFTRCTGLDYNPPAGGWSEIALIIGRQAGKTRVGSLLVDFEAAFAEPCRDGDLYAILVSQDARAAQRTGFSYVRGWHEASPVLRSAIVAETRDTIDLSNGTRIAVYPCRPSALRGLRARIVLLDELAWFKSTDGNPVDTEMLRACRPCLATTGGKLVILSSPYGQSGALWELHRRHHGRQSDTLVWQCDAPTLNTSLPLDYLRRMEQDDPEAYRSEVLGEFRAGLSTLLDPEAIEACVATDRLELPPVDGLTYKAFTDPSGGRRDAFSVCVGHRDGKRAVVDSCRGWQAPFNPSGVVEECAALLRSYRITRVTGDRFGGEWPREAFRSHGITYDIAEKAKSDYYLALVAHVNAASLEIPDDPKLLRELRGLERKRGPSGRDRVDHRPNSTDDRANSLAGLADMILGKARGVTWGDLYDNGGVYYDEHGNRPRRSVT